MCAEFGGGVSGFRLRADSGKNVENVRLGAGVEEFVDQAATD